MAGAYYRDRAARGKALAMNYLMKVDLARRAGLTLIGRAKGKRFLVLSGAERLDYDADPSQAEDEPAHLSRKGSHGDDH